MTEKQDGGPAFPKYPMTHGGMSLRDWFAGQALVGILASHARTTPDRIVSHVEVEVAYELADQMLAHRKGE